MFSIEVIKNQYNKLQYPMLYGIIPVISIVIISSIIVTYFIIQQNIFTNSSHTDLFITSITTLLFGILSIIYLYIHTQLKNKNLIHSNNWDNKMIPYVIFGIISLLFLNTFINLLFKILNIDVGTNIILQNIQNQPLINVVFLILVMLLIVGPCEEIMTRGILQGSFRQNYTKNKSIIFTSFIFALLHISSTGSIDSTVVPYIISTFILSIILGYIYEKTENIFVPMIAHGVYNSLIVLSVYLNSIGII